MVFGYRRFKLQSFPTLKIDHKVLCKPLHYRCRSISVLVIMLQTRGWKSRLGRKRQTRYKLSIKDKGEPDTCIDKKKINARGGAKTNSIVIVTLALASPPIESNFTRAFRQMQQRCKGGRYCYRYLSPCPFPGTPRASESTLGALLIEFLMNVWSLPVSVSTESSSIPRLRDRDIISVKTSLPHS